MIQRDVVFLVPGFLGFERSGNLSYFGDRVTSALRASLEDKLGRAVPVIAIPSLPTASLAERQSALLRALVNRHGALGGADRIHLIGHSTGGIDAHLLSCVRPLEGHSWATARPEDHEIVSKIASVVSIGSPHRGTCLAMREGTRALTPRGLLQNPGGARSVLELLSLLVSSAWADVDASDFAFAAAREGRKVSHFVAELLRWQGLLRALTPDSMEALYRRMEPRDDVHRRSFVTLAGKPTESKRDPSGPDAFFQELSRRAAGQSPNFTQQGPDMKACLDRVREAAADPARVIVSPRAALPGRIDAGSNDGIVNSARQLISPQGHDELAAVVVADHFDVLGYYPRSTWIRGREGQDQLRDVVSGLLHSGCHFRDAEFFALYRRVAGVIAQASGHVDEEPLEPSEHDVAPVTALHRRPSRRPAAG